MSSTCYVAVTPASEVDAEDGGVSVSLPPLGATSYTPSSASRSSLPDADGGSPVNVEFDNFNTPANRTFYSKSPYKKLDAKTSEIRLLRFRRQPPFPPETSQQRYHHGDSKWPGPGTSSGAHNATLSCEMLDNRVLPWVEGQYIALSYCAGSAESTRFVTVNGEPFNVFANLAHAIECALQCWSARNTASDGDLVIWADQICINQADQDERASQVSMMKEIYRNSAGVYVCLSTPDLPPSISYQGAGDGPGWMLWASELTCVHEPAGTPTRTNTFSSTTPRANPISTDQLCSNLRRRLNNTAAAEAWTTSLEQFLLAPWWRRAWVYQEFVMARQVHFMHQSTSISWDELSPLLEFVCHRLQTRLDSWWPPDQHQHRHHHHAREERKPKKTLEGSGRAHSGGGGGGGGGSSSSSSRGRTISVHERQIGQRREEKQQLERDLQAARLARPSRFDRAMTMIRSPFNGTTTIQGLKKRIDDLEREIQRLESGPQEAVPGRRGGASHAMQRRRPKDLAAAAAAEPAADVVGTIGQHLRDRLAALAPARRTVLSIASAQEERPTALTDLLQHARNCLSSDPRDRVYAFVGLAEGEYAVTPCYDKANTVERVLIDTALAIIAHDGDLGVLSHVGCRSGPVVFDGDGIPTWVPDWTAPEDRAGLEFRECVRRLRDGDRAAGPFCASAGCHHSPRPVAAAAPRPTVEGPAEIPEGQPQASAVGQDHDRKMHLPVRGVLLGRLGNAVVRRRGDGGGGGSASAASRPPRPGENRNVDGSLSLPVLHIHNSAAKFRVVVPRRAGYGDEVWVLQGANLPVVLRPQKNNGSQYFSFLGESVVLTENEKFADVMFGQAMKDANERRETLPGIYLV